MTVDWGTVIVTFGRVVIVGGATIAEVVVTIGMAMADEVVVNVGVEIAGEVVVTIETGTADVRGRTVGRYQP